MVDHFAKSDRGVQRQSNEDRCFARSPLFAVADGMGGARAGEVAAEMVREALEAELPAAATEEERLAERAREVNRRIHERAQSDPAAAGMGTTFTAAYVGEDAVALAHVGDSRAYRLRDGHLEQMTDDHSLVGELVRRGKLTEEEAEDHPQRSVITRALGPEPDVEVDTCSVPARAGDLWLLCSDGLSVDGRRGHDRADPARGRRPRGRRPGADRRRQPARRARQHHRRPVPPRGGRGGRVAAGDGAADRPGHRRSTWRPWRPARRPRRRTLARPPDDTAAAAPPRRTAPLPRRPDPAPRRRRHAGAAACAACAPR